MVISSSRSSFRPFSFVWSLSQSTIRRATLATRRTRQALRQAAPQMELGWLAKRLKSINYGMTLSAPRRLAAESNVWQALQPLEAKTLLSTVSASISGNTELEANITVFRPNNPSPTNSTSTDLNSYSAITAVPGQTITITGHVSDSSPTLVPTGIVIFKDHGSTSVGTATLNGSADFSFSTTTLTLGSHSIGAYYQGDSNFTTSGSDPVNATVVQGSSTTTLSAPTTVSLGHTATFTATVAPVAPATPAPTGSVQFFDGTTLFGTGTLSGSAVTFSTTSLTVGTHSITAIYRGDTNYTASSSLNSTVTVTQATTSTTVSATSTVFGQTATISSSVTSTSGTPTGTVRFTEGTNTLATGTLNGSGVASFSISSLAIGTHAITATYSGDSTFTTSSGNGNQVINPIATTVAVAGGPDIVHGQTATLTATVAISGVGSGTPTGTVDFFADGTSSLGSTTLMANGTATFFAAGLSTDEHVINAYYSGDSDFNGSNSTAAPAFQTVNQAATTTSPVATSDTVFGQTATFTATVAITSPGSGTLTGGTVFFYDNTTFLGSGTLSGSYIASFATNTLGVGNHSINATYVGNNDFSASDSSAASTSLTVSQASTSTTVSTTDTVYSETAAFYATVSTTAPGEGNPSGHVTFYSDSISIGTGGLFFGTASLSTASFSSASLSTASHTITAIYSGDSDFATSNGTTSLTVSKSDTYSSVTTSNTVHGQTATFSATVLNIGAGSATPAGIVTFYSDSTSIGQGTLNGSGIATFATSSLTTDFHSIDAIYLGNANFNTSSDSTSITISQAATTTALTSSPNPSAFGQSILLTASVVATAPGAGTPTGIVTFRENNNSIGTGTLNGSGIATFSTSSLAPGAQLFNPNFNSNGVVGHVFTATYGADSDFTASTSTSITQTVTKAATSTTVSTIDTVHGQTATFTASVAVTAPGAGNPTGTVTFYADSISIGTHALVAGIATFSISSLTTASHVITATYSGDTDFTTSNGGTSLTVSQSSTSTTVSTSGTVHGETATFTASVLATAPGAGSPSGSVDFYSDSVSIGQGTIASGVATFSTASLTTASHTITAIYSGDSDFTTSNGSTSLTVGQASTSTSVSTSDTVHGQTATFTASVSVTAPGAGTLSGTVSFYSDSVSIGQGTIASGIATFSTASLTTASHTITAIYSGDSDFTTSNGTTSLTVGQASTSTSVSTSNTLHGQTATFTASVSVTAPGAGAPSGSVDFYSDSVSIGQGTIAAGIATFSTSSLATASHAITAIYSGDSDFTTSNGATSLTIAQASTTTTLNSTSTVHFSHTATFTASVVAVAPGAGIPSGSVTFYADSASIGQGTLVGGVATYSITSLSIGTHSITASYSSDSDFTASSASAVSQVIDQVTTTTTLNTLSPISHGQSVTFTVTVVSGGGTPTGTVAFLDGTTTLGTGTLSSNVTTYTASGLSTASHVITASYLGDGTFLPSSATDTQVVNKAATSTSLAASGATTYGNTVTFTSTITSTAGTPTGSVTYLDGTTSIGTGTLNGSGVTSFATSSLTAGTHLITAVYASDTNFATSTSSPVTQAVAQASAAATLTATVGATTLSDNSGSFHGQSVTFIATISSTQGTPTGTVKFIDVITGLGTFTIATGTLSGGKATFITSSLTTVNHQITAIYSGDINFINASSATDHHFVTRAATTTALQLTTGQYGVPVILGATVTTNAPGSGTPNGTVTFKEGTTTLGTGTLVGGLATLSISSFSIGSHVITAVYGTVVDYNGSTSVNATQTITKATPTVTLASLTATVHGQTATFTATITPPGTGTPSGTVTFLDGTTTLGTAAITSGHATFSISSLSTASHVITASYSGDSFFNTASASGTQVVNQDPTTTSLSSATNPSVFGQSVTFTSTVSSTAPGAGIPTGTVVFYADSTSIGQGTLAGGIATFTTSGLSVTSHTITASYTADGDFLASTSNATSQTVNKADTSSTVSATDTVFGQTSTFTATVVATAPGAGTPGGTVTFYADSASVGTGSLSGGIATFTLSSLSTGSHTITASYSGDGSFNTSATASAMTQTVSKANTSSSVSTSNTVHGQTATFSATVTATAPGAGTPGGTVVFKEGTTTLGTGTLAGGIATFSTSSLSTASHTITAAYAGDTNFNTSSNTASITVSKADTSTSVSTSDTVHGQTATFVTTVAATAPGAGTPTGRVIFLDGTTTLGTRSLSGGAATYSTASLTTAGHTITATYVGDTNFNTSSNTTSITVSKANTSTSVSTFDTVHGQTAIFTASISATAPGAGTPTGTVTFLEGTTTLGSGSMTSAITAYSTSSLATGSHTITASYGGDADFNASSNTTTITVSKSNSITLVTTANTVHGQTATFTASVVAGILGSGTPTGTTTFYVDSVSVGVGTLSGGLTTFSTSTLTTGTHSITATYSGDGDFNTSSSLLPTPITVSKASTSTSIASTINPTVYSQTTSFTATVTATAPGAGVPTGSVTFFEDGSISLGTASLSGGVTTFSTTDVALGSHVITASYNGDSDFNTSSTASGVTQTVNKADTTSTTVANSQSVFGETVTFSVTIAPVSPATGTPTGTVVFIDTPSATSVPETIGTGTVGLDGVATLTVSNLSVDLHTISAVYSGDDNFATSTSNDRAQIVTRAYTTTTLDLSSVPHGATATLAASVTANAPGSGIPDGQVIFYVDSISVGEGTLDGSGIATFDAPNLSTGDHDVYAVYSINDDALNFATSTSDHATQTVTKADTTTTVSSAGDTVHGQTATFTATLSVTSPGAGTPTGTITFFDGTTSIGTGTVDGSGTATFSTSFLSTDAHAITASYSGDSDFNTSTSTAATHTVSQASTSTTLSSPSAADYGTTVTFTATVSVTSPGAGTPTGTITFYDDTTSIGTGTVDGSGVATFSTSSLTGGDHTIVATYDGDTDFSASNSAGGTQTINRVASSITVPTTFAFSFYGQTVTFTATVTSGVASPTGTVEFIDSGDFDGVTVGTATLDGSGHATLVTTGLNVSLHLIGAHYEGDTNYLASDTAGADLTTQFVTRANSTTSLALSPTVYGQSAILTATVLAVTPGTGTGADGTTVTFLEGSTTLGTGTLAGGVATLAISSLSVGSHVITASFPGDVQLTHSTAPAATQVVSKDATTTTLATSPTVFGQTAIFTVTVTANAPGAGTPGGTVTFFDGTTTLGTAALSGGSATLSRSDLSVSTHSITASYSGNANFLANTNGLTTLAVGKASTTTTVGTLTPAILSLTATLTATVAPVAPGAGTPTGNVAFYADSAYLGTGTLSGGSATFTTSSLSLGTHLITAIYGVDSNFIVSTSAAATQVITKYTTATTLTSDTPGTVSVTTPITFTVTVASTFGTPTGSVIIKDNGTSLATVTLDGSGVATYTNSTLAGGTNLITAVYCGDATFDVSTSTAVTQTLTKFDSTTTLVGTPASQVFNNPVTLNATVTSTGGTPNAGQVVFFDSSTATTLGTAALDGTGHASLVTSTLSIGGHNIIALYSGSAFYSSGSSSSFAQVVTDKAATTTDLSSNVPTTIDTGTTATFTASVSSSFGTPDGSVIFQDGSIVLATVAVDGSGIATYTSSTFMAGTRPITATYVGTSIFASSLSPTINEVFVKRATTTTATASTTPGVVGQAITFTATVTSNTTGTPDGHVDFFDTYSGVIIGTGTVDGSGHATFTTSALAAGSHTIIALYSGSGYFAASNNGYALVLPVQTTFTSTATLSASPSGTINVGTTVTLTASITSTYGTPDGTVTFYNNTTQLLGTATLSGGVATLATATLGGGTDVITAIYSGSPSFDSATSAGTTLTLVKRTTTTTLSFNPAAAVVGHTVSFIASVSSPSGTPDGRVDFYDNSTATTLGSVNLVGGLATFSTAALAAGNHTIVALYAGSAFYKDSNNGFTNVLSVTTLLPTSSTLTSNVSGSAAAGTTITFTDTVTSAYGTPNGTVAFVSGFTTVGTSTLDGSGIATFTYSGLNAGTNLITAVYLPPTSPSQVFSASTSPAVTQVITKIASTTTLTGQPASALLGSTVTLVATITSALPVTSGHVDFFDQFTNTFIASNVAIDGAGHATFTTSSLALGTHTFNAFFSGTGQVLNTNSGYIATVAVKAAANVSLAVGGSGITGGNGSSATPYTITRPTNSTNLSLISTTTGSNGSVMGIAVHLYDGATLKANGFVQSTGLTSFGTPAFTAGLHILTVVFDGNGTYGSVTSAQVYLMVN